MDEDRKACAIGLIAGDCVPESRFDDGFGVDFEALISRVTL